MGIGALGEGLGGCASAVLGRVFGWVGGVSYVYLRVFCLLLQGFNFWGGNWALRYVSTEISDFPDISLFPKVLSLKSFGNSFTKFALLDITFRFTCG